MKPLCFLLLSLGVIATASAQTAPTSKPMDVYLLVGQSNMAGRGSPTREDKQPVDRVMVLNKEDKWTSQGEPIHFDKGEAGVGLGFTFGKLRAKSNPAITVGLIPCAVGNTSLDQWQPGGPLYENALRRARLAKESGKLKAILWHQGEAECGSEANASTYASRLAKLVTAFRKDLNQPDLPFVCGELGEFLYPRSKSPFSKAVNEQIRRVPQVIPRSAVALSKDLKDKGDQLHFDSDSLKEFGKRYHEALLTIETRK